MSCLNNIVSKWKMPEKTIKLVHVSSGKTVWLNCPSDAYELGHISDETKSAWKMFNVYPNGFEADMGL